MLKTIFSLAYLYLNIVMKCKQKSIESKTLDHTIFKRFWNGVSTKKQELELSYIKIYLRLQFS